MRCVSKTKNPPFGFAAASIRGKVRRQVCDYPEPVVSKKVIFVLSHCAIMENVTFSILVKESPVMCFLILLLCCLSQVVAPLRPLQSKERWELC